MFGKLFRKKKTPVPIPERASLTEIERERIPAGPVTVPSGKMEVAPKVGEWHTERSAPNSPVISKQAETLSPRAMTILPPPRLPATFDRGRGAVALAVGISRMSEEHASGVMEVLREADSLGLSVAEVLSAFEEVAAAS